MTNAERPSLRCACSRNTGCGWHVPASHYAANWKNHCVSNPAKQDLLLELCQCFHPYLMKYLVMICRGHVPVAGTGQQKFRINKDVASFLLHFLPQGMKLAWMAAFATITGDANSEYGPATRVAA